MDMRNVIKIVAILALLGGRGAIAQTVGTARSLATTVTGSSSLTQDTGLTGEAPVGQRQPGARDVPAQSPGEFERLTPEDAAVDRKLTICRGC
jgi:hypothetical protein